MAGKDVLDLLQSLQSPEFLTGFQTALYAEGAVSILLRLQFCQARSRESSIDDGGQLGLADRGTKVSVGVANLSIRSFCLTVYMR